MMQSMWIFIYSGMGFVPAQSCEMENAGARRVTE